MTDTADRIDAIRKEMGSELLILGHHYQRPAVLTHADAIGDSLELAKRAAAEKAAKKIVFCGVHFMAESADILSSSDQTVYMPEPSAGCPMAGMGDADQLRAAHDELAAMTGEEYVPVVYVNSTAAVKAACGELGGSTCTSSNSAKVFDWAYSSGKRILFAPDEHLGVNTAHDLGLADSEIAVYDPRKPNGGLNPESAKSARMVAWKGFCHVHTAFRQEHMQAVREKWPEAKIIVHPETPAEVLKLADAHGSTSQIIKYIEAAEKGSTIFVGTEMHLVERMAEEHSDRVNVRMLWQSLCPNMYKTTEESLRGVLETWPKAHEIHVDEATAVGARASLDQMLALS